MDQKHTPSPGKSAAVLKGPGGGHDEPSFLFAGFRLEADGSLFRDAMLVHLPPRELAALRLLVENAGHIVTPEQLKEALWGDVNVSADSIPKCFSSLRARLQPEDCIQTIYKRGYRLMAEVRKVEAPAVKIPALPRLAISPFIAEAGVPEHMGTAIAEETIARLSNAQPPLASILARDSIFALASRGLSAQQIGEALHADMILAGTLRALSFHFRLRVEMIRVEDGVQIWVEDLLVERSRVAGLESDLANRLDFRLKELPIAGRSGAEAHISSPSRQAGHFGQAGGAAAVLHEGEGFGQRGIAIVASAAGPPVREAAGHKAAHVRGEAYDTYLRGHHEWQTLERHRMQDGLQHLLRAVELDPDLMAAKLDLINLCVTQSFYGFMSPSTAGKLIRTTAESIPDFEQRGRGVLPAVGWVRFYFDRDLKAALGAMDLSAQVPQDPWVTRARTMLHLSRGRFEEAIAMIRADLREDPYSPWLHGRLAWGLHLAGQVAESIEQTEQNLRQFPGNEGVALYGAMILACNGETARGLQVAEALIEQVPHFDPGVAVHAYALAKAGRTEEARAVLERLQWLSRERFVLKSFTPAIHVALDDFEAAFVELQAADEVRCPWFFQMLADPRLKPLHGHAEFEKLRGILPAMEASLRG